MSFCKDCISGVRHEGTPEGTYEEINGIRTYVATPQTDYPKDKAIIYLTDVFGLELPNNLACHPQQTLFIQLTYPTQLLADDFARNGFKVYAPDLVKGDPVPQEAFNPGVNFDLSKWLEEHSAQLAGARARKVIEGLRAQGITIYGATGYCYGARIVVDLAFDNVIHASVISHPSLLEHKDLDTYIEKSRAPLLINSCEFDARFPEEFANLADEKFASFAPGYQRTFSSGVHHGFAVRCDPNDPIQKAAREYAFRASVEWLIKYLQ
ncbi:Alpha/Beta hydrolase protein [Lactifluus subvellereus]|nr:Alpha/Beta hydrolase protein [Lactifluus subvellereus]